MSPEKKSQKSLSRHKSPKRHKRGVASNVNGTHTHTPPASSHDNSQVQPYQPHSDTSTHYHPPSSTNPQASTHKTFQSIPRPWTQENLISNTSGDANASTPMERWQNEGIQEQSWNAIGSVSLDDAEYMYEGQQDITSSNEGDDGMQ